MPVKYSPPSYTYYPIYLLVAAILFSVLSLIFPFISYIVPVSDGPNFYGYNSIWVIIIMILSVIAALVGIITCIKLHHNPMKYPQKIWPISNLVLSILIWVVTFFKYTTERLYLVENDLGDWNQISLGPGLYVITGGMLCTIIAWIFLNIEIRQKKYYNFSIRNQSSTDLNQTHPNAIQCPNCSKIILKHLEKCPICNHVIDPSG